MNSNPGQALSTEQTPWNFRCSIPSDTSVGSGLVHSLIEEMLARGWSAREQFCVQLAFEEAITNAIRHGNRLDPNKKVDVEFRCDDQEVVIQITDEGPGFDPTQVPDPTSSDLIEVPGGRGVLLINELMTDVRYNEKGNRVTMKKMKDDPNDNS